MQFARISAALTIAALVGAAVTGCTINNGNTDTDSSNGMMGSGQNHSMMENSTKGGFSGTDIMFAQMMITHHQQAVDMGTLAETRASSPALKKLAAEIKAEQAPEIKQMKKWLTSSGSPMTMDHDMGMGGMLSDKEMTALKNASGAEFDHLYLVGMIGHHEGAIQMAQMVVDSKNAEAKALGKAIIESQTKQITYMKKLLGAN